MLRSLIFFVSLAVVTPAFAQDARPVEKPVKEKRVCRREAQMGSNIPHSTCHTAAEWAAIDKESSNAAQAAIATAHQGSH